MRFIEKALGTGAAVMTRNPGKHMPKSVNLRPVLAAFLFTTAIGRSADLAPGAPPLTQDIADLRRDAVEVVFEVQFTARQLREHQRYYAWYWKYATVEWQKNEQATLSAFKGAFDK